jgi:glycosyltransferase involved in cell wall biosynthesis
MTDHHDHEQSDPARLVADPLVSVLMITYNQEQYLEQAVASVLAQRTEFAFEIVLGEDRSTDATRAIAFDLQERHPDRVRVLFSKANVGFQRNARRVLTACRGEYVAILEGDDYWSDPDKLQRQVDLLRSHPHVGVCMSRGDRMDAAGVRERFWDRGENDRLVAMAELVNSFGMLVPTASIVARAERLRRLPDWVFEAPVLDVFLFLGVAAPEGALYLARDTVVYRMAAANNWSSAFARDYERIKVDHARRMLASYDRAIDCFGLDPRTLRRLLSGTHHVLAKAALGARQPLAFLDHARRIHPAYLAHRLRERVGK